MLEFRPASKHHAPWLNSRQQIYLLIGLMVPMLMWLAWLTRGTFPQIGSEGWSPIWEGIKKNWWSEKVSLMSFLSPLLSTTLVLVFLLYQRNLLLDVGADGIRQLHQLPFGLARLFGRKWSIRWADVQSFEVRRRDEYLHLAHGLPLDMVVLVLQLHDGTKRQLHPVYWFQPTDPPRARIKLRVSSLGVLTGDDPSALPENQRMLAKAFADLPAVRALNTHGAAFGHRLSWPEKWAPRELALTNQPEAVALLVGAITVIGVGIVLMSAERHLHLHHVSWYLRLTFALGTLAIWAMLLWFWRQRRLSSAADPALAKRPTRTSKPPAQAVQPTLKSRLSLVFAAVAWIAATGFMTEPLLVQVAKFGHENQAQTIGFLVRGGHITPVIRDANHSDIPPIIPSEASRLAQLKEGSQVELTTRPGLWGLWVYDDQPLRQLADAQGIP
jgi:hypothetical protein